MRSEIGADLGQRNSQDDLTHSWVQSEARLPLFGQQLCRVPETTLQKKGLSRLVAPHARISRITLRRDTCSVAPLPYVTATRTVNGKRASVIQA